MGTLSFSDPIDFSNTSILSESPDTFLARWDSDIERAARHYCRMGSACADDVAQEIRLRLFQAWRGHGGEPPVGYIRKTIRNTALNALRDENRATSPGLRDDMPDATAASALGVEHDLAVAADRKRVADWVHTLPAHLGKVFDLLYGREVSQRGAAAKMGVSQPRIAQLHRALIERGREELTTI